MKRRNRIISDLKALGFRTTSAETTPGARKHWMESYGVNWFKVVDLVEKRYGGKGYGPLYPGDTEFTAKAPGFFISTNSVSATAHHIFVSRYRRGPAGVDYRHGLDT
jgi:hypothetical protein